MKTKLLSLLLLTAAFSSAFAQGKQDVINSIKKVNNYWQEHNSAQCRGFWDNAAYFTGNQAVYELTGEQKYLDYAIKWAEYNHWRVPLRQTNVNGDIRLTAKEWISFFLPTGRFVSRCI